MQCTAYMHARYKHAQTHMPHGTHLHSHTCHMPHATCHMPHAALHSGDSVELIGASGNLSNNIAISPAISYGDGTNRYARTVHARRVDDPTLSYPTLCPCTPCTYISCTSSPTHNTHHLMHART